MNRRRLPDHRDQRERGAVLIFFALILIGMLIMSAMVVDLGALRARAGKNQSIADMAALAAGDKLSVGDYEGACRDAVTYLAANASALTALNPTALCTQPGNDIRATKCSIAAGATQVRPSQTVANYTVTIHFPVPDSELSDARGGVGVDDGSMCERMRVVVSSSEAAYFGGVVGKSSYTATRSAVIRGGSDPRTRIPALWMLDPFGCTPLSISGGSQVIVGTSSPLVPGVVMIDSDGTRCSTNQVTVSVSGAGTKLAAVPTSGPTQGVISLHALRPGATVCVAPACDPADVASGRMTPMPTGTTERATRTAVDWRFNCKSSYPAYHTLAIPDCDAGTPAYLDLLSAKIGTSGAPGRTTETGSTPYQRWTSSYSCDPTGTVVADGNWWIDCPGGLSIGNGTDVVFTGGNLVFDGGLSMTGGSLTVNSANTGSIPATCLPPDVTTPCNGTSSADAAIVYVRRGDWNATGGRIDVRHAFVHLVNGYIKIAGAAPSWTAPRVGPFLGMSLWSEASSSKFQINGGSGVELTGIFFTPEAAPMSLSGGGDWGQLNAQFVSYQLAVSGGANLTMAPDPTSVALPPRDRQLIR